MAIRNYVGARYVPKFADPVEWQANTSYEAMVIVTYNNSSYTSKIPVPPTVGNPAENSKYWALTGNYNAQVEEYRQTTSNHINNKSNPHNITKDQIGLANVSNYDQSKAIKSITRNGTTFTATALDGSTTTFNQQDNNTTYSIATTTSDGLMSAEDKISLDAKADKTTTNALGKRIDNLILSSGTESSAEVVDARNGYDGTTYDTLGTAIRTQVSELNSDLIASLRQVKPTYVIGSITENGNDIENTKRARTGFVKICNGSQIKIKCVYTEGIYFSILAYDTEKKYVKVLHDSWTTLLANGEAYTETVDFVGYVRICVRVKYDRTITDEIIQQLEENTYVNVIGDLNLYENVEGLTKKVDDLTGDTKEYGVFGKEYFDTFVSAIPSEDITFAIQTDTHCAFTNGYPKSFENLKNAVTLSKMTDLNCILHLGDLVNGWTNLPNQMRDIAYAIDIYSKSNTKVLNLMGNHDDNSWYSAEKGAKIASECVTQSIWERLVMEKMSNIVRFPDRRYFSFDIPYKKTRIICLDTSDLDYTAKNADGKLAYVGQYNYVIRQEQLDWLINSLKSRSDWRYIICSHVSLNDNSLFNVSVIKGVIEAFKNKTTYTGTSTKNGITISADVDFTDSESAGILVGCFAGHTHKDTLNTVNGVTYVTTNCSMVQTDSSTETRKTTDNTSDVIDVVSVNYSARKVTLKRFGYGSDREFTF